MKILFLAILSLFIAGQCFSQNVVKWQYITKKISDKIYEVHIKASVQSPWHIYSQSTPDGGPLPTKISFSKNPLIQLHGKAKENGKLVTKHEDVFGVDVKYFDGDVEFVQVIELKVKGGGLKEGKSTPGASALQSKPAVSPASGGHPTAIKTNVSGTIEFMACNDEQCLSPASVKFSVMVGETK